jgi:hypothetical protein
MSIQNIKNTCSFHDQVNPGEIYDPSCHLLNPLQSEWMEGRRQVKEGFLSLETWIVSVCHPDREWARLNI